MAILDCEDNDYYPTENIILTDQRKRYDIGIHSHHWQLRALTGLASDNVLCFPGGHNHSQIHTLNLHTSERFALNKLKFAPRCLTAGNGWVCCGGENGEFSAVQIGPPDLPKDGDLDYPHSRLVPTSGMNPKSEQFAKDRVNCVTMWFPPTDQPTSYANIQRHPCAYDEPVAVLANNDKTVTLVSLRNFAESSRPRPICQLQYPDFVNRALISPDGQLLAAVLDDPYLYIHRRIENDAWKPQDDPRTRFTWQLQDTFLLKGQFAEDKTDQRGSFALTFSPSGQYLAVGTQHGVVSVYDVDKLCVPGEDALLKTFNSSRPGNTSGAIRDMAFCPGPHGLLAWTEDRGRVGIADVNSDFYRRQIISLRESETFVDQDLVDRSQISFSTLSAAQHTELLTDAFRRLTSRPLRNSEEEDYLRQAELLREFMSDAARLEDEPTNDDSVSTGHSLLESALMINTLYQERNRRLRNSGNVHDSATGDSNFGSIGVVRRPIHSVSPETYDGSGSLGASSTDRTHASRPHVGDPAWRRNLARGGLVATNQGNGVYRITRAGDSEVPVLRRGNSSSSPTLENTSGMVWSSDGNTLYVGSENGIYEMHVNTLYPKMRSCVELR